MTSEKSNPKAGRDMIGGLWPGPVELSPIDQIRDARCWTLDQKIPEVASKPQIRPKSKPATIMAGKAQTDEKAQHTR